MFVFILDYLHISILLITNTNLYFVLNTEKHKKSMLTISERAGNKILKYTLGLSVSCFLSSCLSWVVECLSGSPWTTKCLTGIYILDTLPPLVYGWGEFLYNKKRVVVLVRVPINKEYFSRRGGGRDVGIYAPGT